VAKPGSNARHHYLEIADVSARAIGSDELLPGPARTALECGCLGQHAEEEKER